jgi:hypothetical protein
MPDTMTHRGPKVQRLDTKYVQKHVPRWLIPDRIIDLEVWLSSYPPSAARTPASASERIAVS